MSLLGNHNNEFEKRLRKQLDDTEFKPAESLWDRIDREVNRPEFEKRVEGRIGQYEVHPRPETWVNIEEQLPPEPSRWRRAGKLWYGLALLLFMGGAFLGHQLSQLPEHEIVQAPASGPDMSFTESKPRVPVTLRKEAATEHPAKEPISQHSSGNRTNHEELPAAPPANKPVSGVRPAGATGSPAATVHVQSSRLSNTKQQTGHAMEQENGTRLSAAKQVAGISAVSSDQPKKTGPEQRTASTSGSEQLKPSSLSGLEHSTANTADDEKLTGEPEQTSEDVITRKTEPVTGDSVLAANDQVLPGDSSASANVAQTGKRMQQVSDSVANLTPALFEPQVPARLSISILAGLHQSNMILEDQAAQKLDGNIALRRRVEVPKMDFTGGFLLDYKVSKRILISSGIVFTGFTMDLKYGITPASKEVAPKAGATYTNTSDSITPGSGLSNRIHYSWNEIPLFITFRSAPGKRVGFEARTGISYAVLNTVDAAMIGQENIGVLLLKNKESFPYMKNSFFVHLYAGMCVNVNESVSLSVMPYFKYSLNNMIDNENWVKQYPLMMGLSLGLRKSF